MKVKPKKEKHLRDDENFTYVAAWEFKELGKEWNLHKEPLGL